MRNQSPPRLHPVDRRSFRTSFHDSENVRVMHLPMLLISHFCFEVFPGCIRGVEDAMVKPVVDHGERCKNYSSREDGAIKTQHVCKRQRKRNRLYDASLDVCDGK